MADSCVLKMSRSSADSDSDEFYDATEGEDVTSPLRRLVNASEFCTFVKLLKSLFSLTFNSFINLN